MHPSVEAYTKGIEDRVLDRGYDPPKGYEDDYLEGWDDARDGRIKLSPDVPPAARR